MAIENVSKYKLKEVLEPFIYKQLDRNEYHIENLNPNSLLTWNRFDLGFKLFYLDANNNNEKLAIRVYKEDIRSQTLGDFQEYGNQSKDSFEKYIEAFDRILNSIGEKGFDDKKTIVPLSKSKTIVNGAHRVASAIHQNKSVKVAYLDLPVMTCDYKYFYDRNVSTEILDIVASKMVEYSENTYIAFLWPSGKDKKIETEKKFSNVIYKKDIKLNKNGAFNLLYELYKHMDWVGTNKNGFLGINQKLVECFPDYGDFSIVIFQSSSIEDVRILKEEIREIHKIGFSSIHITDTKEEAIRISRLILNDNGIHFLNYADPFKFSFKSELIGFRTLLEDNNLKVEDVIIDGSILLTLYGLRKNLDLDFLISNKYVHVDENIETHDSELIYHAKDKQDLIYNPENYFYYEGLKFVSFNQLYEMKLNRNEVKDKVDCELMEALVKNNYWKKISNKVKQQLLYFIIKVRSILVNLTRKVGLYDFLRNKYYKIMNF